MPHAMQKLGLQGAQCYFHRGKTRRKVIDKQPPLNTKVFYAPLTGGRLHKFLSDYGGTDHFSLMTLDEYHITGLQKSALVCHVPFVNRPFESEIHGTVNFTQFYCVLLVTWCYRVLLSCYLRPK